MSEAPARSRWRDIWQLDLPLAIVLIGCSTATVIELARAQDGFWRAWVYTFEWPLIGAFAVWIWFRYRFRGGIRRARRVPTEPDSAAGQPQQDPQLSKWQEYQRRLRENATPEE